MVQDLAKRQGDVLSITSQTLRKRLKENQYLASWEEKRETVTIRKTLEGRQISVLHFHKSILRSPVSPHKEPDKPDSNASLDEEKTNSREPPVEEPDSPLGSWINPTWDSTSKSEAETESCTAGVGNVGFANSKKDSPETQSRGENVSEQSDTENVGFIEEGYPTGSPDLSEEEGRWEG